MEGGTGIIWTKFRDNRNKEWYVPTVIRNVCDTKTDSKDSKGWGCILVPPTKRKSNFMVNKTYIVLIEKERT